VGGPDNLDAWVDDRDQFNPAVGVSLLNNAGFSAALAGLVAYDINMAKCQQGNGFIQVRGFYQKFYECLKWGFAALRF
jgi:hypothetical protein